MHDQPAEVRFIIEKKRILSRFSIYMATTWPEVMFGEGTGNQPATTMPMNMNTSVITPLHAHSARSCLLISRPILCCNQPPWVITRRSSDHPNHEPDIVSESDIMSVTDTMF